MTVPNTFASGTLISASKVNENFSALDAKLAETVSVKDFGAVGNGVSNDAAAFVLADALGTTVFVPFGTYVIGSSITLNSDYVFAQGAVLSIGNGVTVTFNGNVQAAPRRIFTCTGTGAVAFNPAKTAAGYAEWWGATVNDPSAATTNVTAINAAIVALRKVQLLAGTYWTNARIYIGVGYRELCGVGEHYDGVSNLNATRILCTSATSNVLVIGPDVYPGSVNAMPEGVCVHDLLVDRSVAPDVGAEATGLRVQYLLRSYVSRVRSEQSIYSFRYFGTVYCKIDDCDAFRSVAGVNGTDKYYGHYIDGGANIGLNGGNASIYLNRCVATIGGISIANSNGFYCDQKFTDTFIIEPETAGTAIGINVQGNANNASLNYQNTNMQIVSPVVDAFTTAGIYFQNVNNFGSAEVLGGYYAPAAGATAALWIRESQGVTIIGGQMLMGVAPACRGAYLVSSVACRISPIILEAGSNGAVVLDGVTSCEIKPDVKNRSTTCSVAVQLFSTNQANIIEPLVSGGANLVSLGVQVVGTADNRNEYRCTGLNSGCIAAGSANKLVRNGVQITATGLSGTNLVSGVMT